MTDQEQEKKLPVILKELKAINKREHIKIRSRKGKKGYSLFLDNYAKGNRSYEFLQIYLHGTLASLKEDQEKLAEVKAIRAIRETERRAKRTGFQLESSLKDKIDFKEYLKAFIIRKKTRSYAASLKHLHNYHPGALPVIAIDEKFCENFKNYLLTENINRDKIKGNLARNSAKLIFFAFKTCLKSAVKDKIIQKNPAEYMSIPKMDTKREYLTLEEVEKLRATPHKNFNIKNAFIFSCFTGLRLSDVEGLKFSDIQGDHLFIRMQKTEELIRLKLNKVAKEIIRSQKTLNNSKQTDNVFKLPGRDSNNLALRRWAKKAGLTKYIFFHISRHTFATMCLTKKIDLFTVQKLLGHKSIQMTQIYANLIDEIKDDAMDKLSEDI